MAWACDLGNSILGATFLSTNTSQNFTTYSKFNGKLLALYNDKTTTERLIFTMITNTGSLNEPYEVDSKSAVNTLHGNNRSTPSPTVLPTASPRLMTLPTSCRSSPRQRYPIDVNGGSSHSLKRQHSQIEHDTQKAEKGSYKTVRLSTVARALNEVEYEVLRTMISDCLSAGFYELPTSLLRELSLCSVKKRSQGGNWLIEVEGFDFANMVKISGRTPKGSVLANTAATQLQELFERAGNILGLVKCQQRRAHRPHKMRLVFLNEHGADSFIAAFILNTAVAQTGAPSRFRAQKIRELRDKARKALSKLRLPPTIMDNLNIKEVPAEVTYNESTNYKAKINGWDFSGATSVPNTNGRADPEAAAQVIKRLFSGFIFTVEQNDTDCITQVYHGRAADKLCLRFTTRTGLILFVQTFVQSYTDTIIHPLPHEIVSYDTLDYAATIGGLPHNPQQIGSTAREVKPLSHPAARREWAIHHQAALLSIEQLQIKINDAVQNLALKKEMHNTITKISSGCSSPVEARTYAEKAKLLGIKINEVSAALTVYQAAMRIKLQPLLEMLQGTSNGPAPKGTMPVSLTTEPDPVPDQNNNLATSAPSFISLNDDATLSDFQSSALEYSASGNNTGLRKVSSAQHDSSSRKLLPLKESYIPDIMHDMSGIIKKNSSSSNKLVRKRSALFEKLIKDE
ncbi:hypothetical protein EJ08DRAFT_656292 [Tothia fuscella]|uniref:Uncharacterized protein n=1 Tax=Tothia fuscella TaxID=1048955 RepID=A0A9P4P270_9PEZI|nr:hypothetical protein EJ08DRAFT_656292 [Tothia fuscella]